MNEKMHTTTPAGAPVQPRSICTALQDFQTDLAKAHAVIFLALDVLHEDRRDGERDRREGFFLPYREADHAFLALDLADSLLAGLQERMEPIIDAAASDRAGGQS